MSDYTSRCTPARDLSCARAVAGVQSNVNSVVARVTALETTTADHEDRITELEGLAGVSESAFVIVDNEAEFDAAIATGKHLLLRGEGNGGEISLTGVKDIDVPGTRIWGYGYKPGATSQYSKIKFDHPSIPNVGNPNLYGLKINAADIDIGGFEVQGNDALDLNKVSYIAFRLSTTVDAARFHLHDIVGYNLCQLVGKDGGPGAAATTDMRLERLYAHTLTAHGVGMQQSVNNGVIRDCKFIPKPTGYGLTFTITKGIQLGSDINDMLIENVRVENCAELGIELTSTVISGANFHPMYRNRVIACSTYNTGSFGISFGFATDGLIQGCHVESAVGIGIESAAGYIIGQTNRDHNNRVLDNVVRNVTSPSYATGIVADKTVGDLIRGNLIEGVTSDFAGASAEFYTRGILAYDGQSTTIDGNKVRNVDGTSCYLLTAAATNMNAHHIVRNNDFRVTAAETKARYAVYVFNSRAVVRNNEAWEPTGGTVTQKYEVNNAAPATVYTGADWSTEAQLNQLFTDTNLRLTY